MESLIHNYEELCNNSETNFEFAKRIALKDLDHKVIEQYLYKEGVPLVITNASLLWRKEKELFTLSHLDHNVGHKTINVLNDENSTKIQCSVSEYIETLTSTENATATPQKCITPVPCPAQWEQQIQQKLAYFSSKGGNDLLSEIDENLQWDCLQSEIQIDQMYQGITMGTMGTIVNNLLVKTPNKNSFTLWFCSRTQDRDVIVNHWNNNVISSFDFLSENNEKLVEITEMSKYPCLIYIIQQFEGDFVLLPSQSIYQRITKVFFFFF